MKKSILTAIMTEAWNIRKTAAKNFSCKVSEISFSRCLKQAWDFYKKVKRDEKAKNRLTCCAVIVTERRKNRYNTGHKYVELRGGVKGTGQLIDRYDFFPELQTFSELANWMFKRQEKYRYLNFRYNYKGSDIFF